MGVLSVQCSGVQSSGRGGDAAAQNCEYGVSPANRIKCSVFGVQRSGGSAVGRNPEL